LDAAVVDDEQGRQRLDPEPLDQVGTLAGVDPGDLERVVVSSPLKHLRKEASARRLLPSIAE
jgi:hypothetical protein